MSTIDESEETILESVADALLALSNVGYGDYNTRLTIDPNDRGPLSSLFAGINEMIASLGVEQEKSRAYQQELEEKLAIAVRSVRSLNDGLPRGWTTIETSTERCAGFVVFPD